MTNKINISDLLKSGMHFGHLTRKWNPNMASYIYMERNGIHVINLYKTAAKIEEASKALSKIVASGRKVLFVATKKQAKEVVESRLKSVEMPYITERWPGGMLTNFVTIRRAVRKMGLIDKMKQDNTFDALSKKEKLQIGRLRIKLEKNLGSISNMTRLPGAIFVVDVLKEQIAVKEAKKLNIPIFAIVDTNSDPRGIDYVIPANDDTSKSIDKILSYIIEGIKEGLSQREENQEKKETHKKEAHQDKRKPEAKKAEAKESEVKKPEVKKPEVKKPEVKKSEAKESEVKKPEVKKPEVKKPEAKKPEAKKPEAKKPEAKKPEAKKPEAKKPEAKKPEAKKPEAKKPEAKKPEAKKPEAKKPEAKKPEAKKPEAKKPEAKKK